MTTTVPNSTLPTPASESGPIRGALTDIATRFPMLPARLAEALDEHGGDTEAFAWINSAGVLLNLEIIKRDMPLEDAVRIVAEDVASSEPEPFDSVADAIAYVRDTLTLPGVDVPGGFPMTDYGDTESAAYRRVLEASDEQIREATLGATVVTSL